MLGRPSPRTSTPRPNSKPRLRLADCSRTAQPPQNRYRADAAVHADLRPPEPQRGRRLCGTTNPGKSPCRTRRQESSDDRRGSDGTGGGFRDRRLRGAFSGASDADEFGRCCWKAGMRSRRCPGPVGCRRVLRPGTRCSGKVVTRRAGFVDDVLGFDAPFFGMSAREVRLMDPQHRLLLETAWRAVEHSGTAPTALAEHQHRRFRRFVDPRLSGNGIRRADLPRDRGLFGHRDVECCGSGPDQPSAGAAGPAVAVDTACSSSLVAIHQACQALRSGSAISRWPAVRTRCSPRRP